MRKFHLISGLPRSGSTLLAAILRQNPRFHAGVTSPLASLCDPLVKRMSGGSEFAAFFDDHRRETVLRGLFEGYYARAIESEVIFDTNRLWTGRAALLAKLYPASRIICCVREVAWIIDSIERALRLNALQNSRVFSFEPGSSIYGRVERLMNSETGLIGLPWATLREASFGEFSGKLILLSYDALVSDPVNTLQRLYSLLGEPYFRHDLEHVNYDEPNYDAHLGMPGLHRVSPIVKKQVRAPVIPPDIFDRYADSNFWFNLETTFNGERLLGH